MSVYIPNEAEKEALKAILLQQAMVLFLFKNQIQPDGNTVFATLEEMPTGGGRGYAPFVLTNNVKEGVVVADKWAMTVNASGKAEATYSNALKVWTFLAPDVADVNTVFGVGGYFLILPFTTGAKEIKVGDTIKQGSQPPSLPGSTSPLDLGQLEPRPGTSTSRYRPAPSPPGIFASRVNPRPDGNPDGPRVRV